MNRPAGRPLVARAGRPARERACREGFWAERSWDEMFNGFYEYSVAMPEKPQTEN